MNAITLVVHTFNIIGPLTPAVCVIFFISGKFYDFKLQTGKHIIQVKFLIEVNFGKYRVTIFPKRGYQGQDGGMKNMDAHKINAGSRSRIPDFFGGLETPPLSQKQHVPRKKKSTFGHPSKTAQLTKSIAALFPSFKMNDRVLLNTEHSTESLTWF